MSENGSLPVCLGSKVIISANRFGLLERVGLGPMFLQLPRRSLFLTLKKKIGNNSLSVCRAKNLRAYEMVVFPIFF